MCVYIYIYFNEILCSLLLSIYVFWFRRSWFFCLNPGYSVDAKVRIQGNFFGFSARLFQFLGAETRVCLKAGRKYAFGEAETQLLYKSCVLDKGINAQDNYGPLEAHKQKIECVFEWCPLALPKNTKLPLINGFSSHAVLIPLISSLYFALSITNFQI